MRNGRNPELGSQLDPEASDQAFANLSIEKPRQSTSTATSQAQQAREELSGTSFSFGPPRLDAHAVNEDESLQPGTIDSRLSTVPKLEAELSPSPPPSPKLNQSIRHGTQQARSSITKHSASKGLFKSRGTTSLLDRYVSFLARILKALEKLLLRRFNKEASQKQNQQASNEIEESLDQENQPLQQKRKKRAGLSGPNIT